MANRTRRRRNPYRSTVVLAVATLAALGAVVWSHRRVPDSVRDERHARLLRTFRHDAIDRIERTTGDGARTELFKEAARWYVSDGHRRFSGDDSEVERVLSEAEYATPMRRLGRLGSTERARYGLDRPRARVVLREGTGPSLSFSVGGVVEGESAVYVEVEGEGFVAPQSFADAFLEERSAYRDKQLARVDPARATRLELEGGEGEAGRRVLERQGAVWFLREPALGRVARAKLDAALHVLGDLRATRYVTDDAPAAQLESLGLTRPFLTVRVTRTEGGARDRSETDVLRVGGPCPGHDDERVVRRGDEGSVACVAQAAIDELRRSAEALRDDRALWARVDEVERVQVHASDAAGGAFSVRRDRDGWRLEGATGAADADAIESWLRALEELRVEARAPITEAASRGLEPGTRWIEVSRTGVDGSEKLWLGAADADRFYARRDGESEVLAFAPSAAMLFAIDAARFRPRALWRDVPDEMVLFSVEGPSMRDEAQRAAGAWRLTRPFSAYADPTSMHQLAEDFATLDADRWVALTPRSEHGLATPRARVTVRFEGAGPAPEPEEADGGARVDAGPRPRVREFTVTVGASAPAEGTSHAGYFATLSTRDGVFVLDAPVVDRLLTPHVDRVVFEVDRDNIASLEIAEGARRVALRRDGALWRTEDGVAADRARVDALLEGIALVRAPQVTGYGPSPASAQLGAMRVSLTHETPSNDGGAATRTTRTVLLGAAVSSADDAPVYARVEGIDATLTIPKSVAELLRAFRP